MKQRSGWLTRHWHRSTHIRLLAFLCLSLFFCALPLFVWACAVNCGPSALGFSARGGLEVKQRLISFFWKVFSSRIFLFSCESHGVIKSGKAWIPECHIQWSQKVWEDIGNGISWSLFASIDHVYSFYICSDFLASIERCSEAFSKCSIQNI